MTTYRDESISMAGGGEMNLSVWVTERGTGPGVLLLQEIFGVGDRLRRVAERLAERGYVVGAPEVFWRIAPGWSVATDEAGVAEAMGVAGRLDLPQAIDDCGAALEMLGRLAEVDGRPGLLGFCLGGSLAFGVAVAAAPAVCVSYYGSAVRSMLDQIDQVRCPTLFHFGSLDPYIPGADVEAIAVAIAGRADTVLNVEIAGHAFDNESALFHDEAAAASAWAKTMAFLAEHLPTPSGD